MNISKAPSKLALGTVQFGIPYGIANKQGQVLAAEARAILDLARANKIQTIDTAIAYGESEKVLGEMPLDDFEIITKLPAVPNNCQNIQNWVDKELNNSFSRLKVSSVNALLLHRPEDLLSKFGGNLYKALQKTKEEGLVKRVGISIYSPCELEQLTKRFQFDLVQAPFSIIDNRLEKSGWLEKLASTNTQIHARSVFMQGLLLMPDTLRPIKFNRWAPLWTLWHEWLEETGLTPLQACLRYVLSVPEIEKVVVGVDSAEQLSEIIMAAQGDIPKPLSELVCSDINLLNPSLWNQL